MLALDTVGARCQVALKHNDIVRVQISKPNIKNTEVILEMILAVCAESQLELANISKIIVTNGPGSFTGVRVGLIIAQMLAFASNAQVFQVNSCLALAYSASKTLGNGCFGVMLDARMQEYYYSEYNITNSVITVKHEPNKIKQAIFSNNCDYRIADFTIAGAQTKDLVIETIFDLIKNIAPTALEDLAPVYLRDPV